MIKAPNLADGILFFVGGWQWRRMNARRYGIERTLRRFDFMIEMRGRLVWYYDNEGSRCSLTQYLFERLTPERLALPDNFNKLSTGST